MSDTNIASHLRAFRRFSRATPASQHLCQMLVESVRSKIGSVPVEAGPDQGTGEPPFLIYMPDNAPRFALIDTISSRKTKVVVSIYGKQADHDQITMRALSVPPRKGFSRIAIQDTSEVQKACDVICQAYEMKVQREQQRDARRLRSQ